MIYTNLSLFLQKKSFFSLDNLLVAQKLVTSQSQRLLERSDKLIHLSSSTEQIGSILKMTLFEKEPSAQRRRTGPLGGLQQIILFKGCLLLGQDWPPFQSEIIYKFSFLFLVWLPFLCIKESLRQNIGGEQENLISRQETLHEI